METLTLIQTVIL